MSDMPPLCPWCGEVFLSVDDAQIHALSRHAIVPQRHRVECPLCNWTVSKKKYKAEKIDLFMAHLDREHGGWERLVMDYLMGVKK